MHPIWRTSIFFQMGETRPDKIKRCFQQNPGYPQKKLACVLEKDAERCDTPWTPVSIVHMWWISLNFCFVSFWLPALQSSVSIYNIPTQYTCTEWYVCRRRFPMFFHIFWFTTCCRMRPLKLFHRTSCTWTLGEWVGVEVVVDARNVAKEMFWAIIMAGQPPFFSLFTSKKWTYFF